MVLVFSSTQLTVTSSHSSPTTTPVLTIWTARSTGISISGSPARSVTWSSESLRTWLQTSAKHRTSLIKTRGLSSGASLFSAGMAPWDCLGRVCLHLGPGSLSEPPAWQGQLYLKHLFPSRGRRKIISTVFLLTHMPWPRPFPESVRTRVFYLIWEWF